MWRALPRLYVAVNQSSIAAVLDELTALSYGQLMNNELVPSTLKMADTLKDQYNEKIHMLASDTTSC